MKDIFSLLIVGNLPWCPDGIQLRRRHLRRVGIITMPGAFVNVVVDDIFSCQPLPIRYANPIKRSSGKVMASDIC